MKCEKCGKDLEGNLKVCSNCGGKITVKKSNKKFIVGISIILLLVVIVVILYFYKNSKYDYESYEKTLEAATKNYILVNKIKLSDKESNIVLGDLYEKKLIDDELEDKCEGYVIASKEIDEEGYEQEMYDAYIKCGIFYRTQGYNDTYAKKTYIEEKDETQEEIEGTRINSNLKDCPNYITNLTKEQLISQYKFEKTIMATDIEGEYETTYSILLSLYDNNVMNVITKAGEQASGENYYGIYKIDGDKLTITRKNPISVNGDQCYDGSKNLENKTDVFTISADKNTLTTSVYLGESSSYTSSKYITGKVELTKMDINKQSKNYEYTTSDTGLKLIVNKEIAGYGYNYADEKGEPVFNNYYNIMKIYKYNEKIYAYKSDSNQYEVYDLKTKKTSQKTTKYIIYNMLENYIQCYDVSSQKVVLLNLNNEVLKEISYVQPDISIQTIHLFKVKEYNPNVKVNTGIYMALFNTNKDYGCDLYLINGDDVKLIDGDYCGY